MLIDNIFPTQDSNDLKDFNFSSDEIDEIIDKNDYKLVSVPNKKIVKLVLGFDKELKPKKTIELLNKIKNKFKYTKITVFFGIHDIIFKDDDLLDEEDRRDILSSDAYHYKLEPYFDIIDELNDELDKMRLISRRRFAPFDYNIEGKNIKNAFLFKNHKSRFLSQNEFDKIIEVAKKYNLDYYQNENRASLGTWGILLFKKD